MRALCATIPKIPHIQNVNRERQPLLNTTKGKPYDGQFRTLSYNPMTNATYPAANYREIEAQIGISA